MGNSKRSKHSNPGVPSVDRISTLPQSLICHILSLLPTQYAVQTSILSKRWLHLWTYATNVAFDGEVFESENDSKWFDNFVSRCMALLNNPCLKQFRLNCAYESDPFQVSTWIYVALSRNVQKLILKIYLCEFEIPIGLFSCKTLSYLSLDSSTVLDVPNSVCLPNLKSMIISGVFYRSEETLPKLLFGCPALEHLSINKDDETDNIFHFTISSPTLKSLVLTFTTEIGLDSPPHILQIDTPLLQYMHLCDHMSSEFVLGNMSSLRKANINVDLNGRNIDETDYGKEIFKLISRLSNVKFLNLSGDTMKVLSYACEHVAPAFFHNLTGLQGDFRSYKNRQRDIQPDHMPKYLLSHLTTVEFADFHGSTDELMMVKFILNGAKSLKRMTLITSHPETKLGLLKEIAMYSRDSKLCELVVQLHEVSERPFSLVLP